jgi:hypothetical protein
MTEPTPPITPPTSPAATPPTTKKRHGLWWKILLAAVILILLLIILAPTLLSTTPGKNFILSQVNSRVPGKLSAEAVSLGWFSGATISKLQMVDDEGKPVVSLDNVDTGITLWNALAGSVVDLSRFNVTGGKMPQLPGVTINIKLAGTADLGKKVINITSESIISAKDDATGKGNIVTLAPNSVLSYGDQPNNAKIKLEYNLEQLQTLIKANLPEGTQMAGQRTTELHITGALTKDEGLRAYRGVSIAETSFGWDKIDCKGVHLGKADIRFQMIGGILTLGSVDVPANGGAFHVSGKIDFNHSPPAYIIERRPGGTPLVKAIGLNHEIAAGPLSFLPLNWGLKPGTIAEIGGQVTVTIGEAYIPLDSAAYKTKGTLAGAILISNLTTEAPFLHDALKMVGPLAQLGQTDLLKIRGGTLPLVPFHLKEGKVSYDKLTIGTKEANLAFSGSVGLDKSIAVNMTLSLNSLKLPVPIPIGIRGTIEKPELALTENIGTGKPGDPLNDLLKQGPGLINDLLNKNKKPNDPPKTLPPPRTR